MSDGAALIQHERWRQIEVEGFTSEHDAGHLEDEALLRAAECYLTPVGSRGNPDDRWPWAPEDWKPTPDDRVRELVKAGALIAAEIDRLQATEAK